MKKAIDNIVKIGGWISFLVMLCVWLVTILIYGEKIDSNTKATKANTQSVNQLINIGASTKQWIEDHNQRHLDHKALHEAERNQQ